MFRQFIRRQRKESGLRARHYIGGLSAIWFMDLHPPHPRDLLAEVQKDCLPLPGVHAQRLRLLSAQFLILAIPQIYMAGTAPVSSIVAQKLDRKSVV